MHSLTQLVVARHGCGMSVIVLLLIGLILTGLSPKCDESCALPHNRNVTLCWGPGPDLCQKGEISLTVYTDKRKNGL
jgi:hypothetical protein